MELNGQVELMLVLLIGEMFAFIIQDYVVWNHHHHVHGKTTD